MFRQDGTDVVVELSDRGDEYRVLKRLEVREGWTSVEYDGGATSIGIVVDVETTGKEASTDHIIELAMRRFRYDRDGRILKIGRIWSWREDPGRALDPEIVRLTGITNADLVGQRIDAEAATRLLVSAQFIIAHNAAFDRKFVERRLPEAAGRAWACSLTEIDWAAAGFDGRSLGWLCAQAGFFYDAHRAGNDVDAVIALLQHVMPNDRPALAELVDSAKCPTIRVEAFGADFAVKEMLRARGYRWNPDQKVWWREVTADALTAEEIWLRREVYTPERRPRCLGPKLTEMTARERYA